MWVPIFCVNIFACLTFSKVILFCAHIPVMSGPHLEAHIRTGGLELVARIIAKVEPR